MPDDRIRITPGPLTRVRVFFADRAGISPALVIEADLARLDALAAAAMPQLDDWERNLVLHHFPDEAVRVAVERDDAIPSARRLAAEIHDWADGCADYAEAARAGALAQRVVQWTPANMLALLLAARDER